MDNFFFGKNKFSKSESNQEFTEISSNYSRTYSKGKSFKFSIWNEVDTYNNDDFVQDFVQWNQKLWAAKKTSTNIPPTQGEYWELIVEGVSDVEFKQEDNRILWKYEDDLEWKDLFELDSVSEDQIKKMLEDLDIKYRNTYDDTLSLTSTNAVQNQAVTKKFKELDDKNTRTDNELTNIKSSVNTALSNSQSYTDSKISETKIQIDSELNKKANQTDVDETVDELNKSINLKVDKVSGKGLSTNDFNDNYKSKLDNLDSSLNSALTSAKSYTNSEITKVDNKIKSEISRAQASETNLSNRIDGLGEDVIKSLNEAKEYTDALANGEVKNNTNKINVLNGTGEGSVIKTVKDEISNLVGTAPEKLDTLQEIADYLEEHEDMASGLVNSLSSLEQNKVDKVLGKGLSTEDYTTEEKNKLAGLNNYDDTAITAELSALETKVTENKTATDKAVSDLSAKVDEEVESLQTLLDNHDTLIDDLHENKADVSGYYPQLSVGQSDNLPDRGDVTEGLIGFRESAGAGNSIEDGTANVQELLGNSVVWNQHSTIFQKAVHYEPSSKNEYFLLGNIPYYVSAINNHTIFAIMTGVSGYHGYLLDNLQYDITSGKIFVANTSKTNFTLVYLGVRPTDTAFDAIISVLFIDLTMMFGAGNEPKTVEEFYARTNQLVGVDFNAYNEGEVLGVNIKGIKSVNDNAFNGEYAKVLGGREYCADGTITSMGFAKEIGGTTETIVLDSENKFTPTENGYVYASGTDICIHLVHTGYKDHVYTEHEVSESSFDLTPYFPNGMHGINGVRDSVAKSKAVRRFGMVKMKDLRWTFQESNARVYASLSDAIKIDAWSDHIICNIYPTQIWDSTKDFFVSLGSNRLVFIKDSTITSAEAFVASLTDDDILYYELATPIETEIYPQLNMNYKVWDFGTEELLTDSKSAPVLARTIYGFNATDTIRGNKEKIKNNEERIRELESEAVRGDDYQPNLSVGLADNLAGVDVVDSEVNFRRSGGGAISDGVARIEAIKGNSVVWNMQYKPYKSSLGTTTNNGITYTVSEDGKVKAEGTAEGATAILTNFFRYPFQTMHKYIFIAFGAPAGEWGKLGLYFSDIEGLNSASIIGNEGYKIFNPAADGFGSLALTAWAGYSLSCEFRPIFCDLTKMFGAGNEPTTIEEFYSRIPMGVDLNAYIEGEVIHMDVQSIESQGVNQWDEEWEVGEWSIGTGEAYNNTNAIRSKNYIPVVGGQQYKGTCIKGNNVGIVLYDAEFKHLTGAVNSITTPSNACYAKIFAGGSYGNVYNHDICINISDASINGKYFPYIKRVEDLAVIRKYFPNGMKSAGSAHDEIRYNKATQKWEYSKGRIKSVDLGTLNWLKTWYNENEKWRIYANLPSKVKGQNNLLTTKYVTAYADNGTMPDISITGNNPNSYIYIKDSSYSAQGADALIASLQGVTLYYESNDWEWVELDAEDQFKDLDYQVWNCGTEKAIAEGKSAPLAADITYGFNAIGKIKELESLVAALRAKVGI